MNKETRIKHIENIKNNKNNIFGKIEIPWQDKLESMNVYKIPLEYLVYNKYNGRILSRTKSLERQGHLIDVENEDGKNKIADLLWKSKIDKNKKTLKSLENYGQEKVGIVTKDGIIIDGNRRAMLLNKIDKYDYFKAVILPISLEDNPLEIEKLETSYQMGEDEKLGYNPIEKYLKTKELMSKLASSCNKKESIDKIVEWMDESKSEIEKYISVMATMDDYLDSLDYNGIYTQLDGREEQFIGLTKWLNSFYNKESGKAFDGYSNDDVDDLKNLAYDYIRIKFSNVEFRKIANGQNDKHLFGNKKIWNEFSEKHFEIIDFKKDNEPKINYESSNIEAHLNDRDDKFTKDNKKFLEDNLNEFYQNVRNNQHKDEPEKLIKNAKKAIESIGQNHSSLDSDLVQNEIKDLNKTINSLLMKSPLKTLEYITEILSEILIDRNNDEDNDKIYKEVLKINKLSFDLKKQLGG